MCDILELMVRQAKAVGYEEREVASPPVIEFQTESQSIFDEYFQSAQQPTGSLNLGAAIEKVLNWRGGSKDDALKLWSAPGELSVLQKLALHTFCVPATSASVERVFSVGGNILTPRRNRLSAEQLSKIMIVKCNNM